MTSSPARGLSAALGLAALVALIGGCGGSNKATVSGTVTLDGAPIQDGTIDFRPTGPTGPTVGGGIVNGQYKLDATPGEMVVEIRATKVVGKHKRYDTPDSPWDEDVASIVPDQYNKLSKLKVTLKAGANDGVNFDLKSK